MFSSFDPACWFFWTQNVRRIHQFRVGLFKWYDATDESTTLVEEGDLKPLQRQHHLFLVHSLIPTPSSTELQMNCHSDSDARKVGIVWTGAELEGLLLSVPI
jgi:hypothetical protein